MLQRLCDFASDVQMMRVPRVQIYFLQEDQVGFALLQELYDSC
jgi:hypothetical protein